ncbi:PREDICTED: uncharacterized protein LOC108360729 [Rhagoletis zephyria]|uniref:uncharacterized protein LOC108360729 n=1 Tax=Rhagoletis zephyria TaxID=28612 RepID=UPI0008114406|nr:PREDICTED: uncharacterized protein LOC108360729 [Rhagoletis zephyria]
MPSNQQQAGYSCKICSKADNSQVVCCDDCDCWFHFGCVKVTASIEHVDWHCADCSGSSSRTMIGAGENKGASNGAPATRPIEQLERKTASNTKRTADVGTPQVTRDLADGGAGASIRTSASNKSARARRQYAEAEIIEEELQILRRKEELLNRRKKFLRELETEDECSNMEEDLDTIAVQKWLNATGPIVPTTASPKVSPTDHQTPADLHNGAAAAPSQPKDTLDGSNNIQSEIPLMRERLSMVEKLVHTQTAPGTGTPWLPKLLTDSPAQPSVSQTADEHASTQPQPNRCLTKNQLAARTSLGKDLPKFNGKPEEWPLFMATYQQTTEMCGFSDAENLLRLRQSLEGAALHSVRNLLLHSSCVPQILETLKMKFGRPELIIAVLLTRIREIPAVKENRLEALVDLALEVQNVCATMKASNMLCHLNNPELEQELVNKLPGLLAAFWGMHKIKLSSCNLESFADWLFQLAQGANSVLVPCTTAKSTAKRGYLNAHAGNVSVGRNGPCIVCHGTCGSLDACNTFTSADRSERWRLIRQHSICRRCLKVHLRLQCASTAVCGTDGCASIHHPLLHNKQALSVSSPLANHVLNAHDGATDSILFRILPVTLYNNNKKLHTYAFFDDGSSLTLMDVELQEKLQVNGAPQPLCLKWTANTHRYEDDSQVLDLKISGADAKKRYVIKDVHTVRKLELPTQTLDARGLQTKYTYLKGLPLPSYINAVPKLLIGLNNSRLGLSLRSREGSDNEPVAEKTRMGWTLKGVTGKQQQRSGYHAFHTCDCDTAADVELLQVVKDYICLDNLEVTRKFNKLMAKEDEYAIEQLKSNTKRIDGRFETSLIWKYAKATLPDSLPSALRRAKCLQAKLAREPELAEIVSSKIAAYVANGYAKPLDDGALSEKGCWYLPIFPVRNPNKPQKVRIVWDAAASTKGVSLNSMLLTGPDQLTCLVSVLRRFRQKAVAVSGDIQEMFHQVRIRSLDQNYQRFLWFESGYVKPSVFVMTVMTFGATCSPSSAQYVKNLNAEEFRSSHPRAVECIVDNHYVDDMLDSVDTEEEAIRLARDVSFVHEKGGFHIRNWHSNSEKVLRALKTNNMEGEVSLNSDEEMPAEKVLGLWWVTQEDCFTFRVARNHKNKNLLLNDRCPTKREVLSIVMSIFDPLGLLNFYVIYAKIMFQEVWRSGCGWDEYIPEEQYLSWQRWVRLLPKIETLRIPRCYFKNVECGSELEMHVFVDASENAYSAVCYLRYNNKGTVDCALVGSKAKVAPLKMLSIPRLELQAAVLGARLAAGVLASHTLHIQRQTFWTDSRTVLAWIRSDHRRYSQFVAFRVSELLELTEVKDWRWLPSLDNVADDATSSYRRIHHRRYPAKVVGSEDRASCDGSEYTGQTTLTTLKPPTKSLDPDM